MDKHLVLLSGGFDSVIAILDLYRDTVMTEGEEEAWSKILPLFIKHPYRSQARESEIASRISTRLSLKLIVVDGRAYNYDRGSRQHEIDMLEIAPVIAAKEGATKVLFGEDVGCDRDSLEEYQRVTEPGALILAGADDYYKEHGFDLEYVAQFEMRRMEILKTHANAFYDYGLSPIWDTYSCFSIVGKDQECGGCWKCFRKYMTCRSVLPRESVLPRFKNEPLSVKNIRKLRKLLAIAEANPKVFGDEPEAYALHDFRDMWKVVLEDMDKVDK